MRILSLIITSIVIVSCSKNYGYVYDESSNKPIKDVVVQDINNPDNKIITDTEGRFFF